MTSEQGPIRSVITPNDQLIRDVFSKPKSYYIDIYQREYKWTKRNIDILLNDFADQFELQNRPKTHHKDIQADVLERFEPYFLNTYLTHTTASNIYIVDGQQRLTTLLLIFIKLWKIIITVEKDASYNNITFKSQLLEKFIFESDDFGELTRCKIFNENRESTFRSLIEDTEINPTDETQRRIKDNYRIISDYYDIFLSDNDQPGRYDVTKLTYYISYLLDRISIVEIKIEQQKNVATIFEVVNDRGIGLKPYEILKGKLIGNLPGEKREKANQIWTELQNSYFNALLKNSTEAVLDLDSFFRAFFRAKFADSENDYEKFEVDYHYEIYRNPKIRKYFKDFTDTDLLYRRITEDIQYFAKVYLWLRTSYENEYLIYNKLLDQNQQYLLVLSGLSHNDPDKDSKITGIAREFDRLHTITRLLNVYESNKFQRVIYPLNKEIRNKSLDQVINIIQRYLITFLKEEEVIPRDGVESIDDIFIYDRFKGISNTSTNFSKYVLMRIDRYLSQYLDNKPSYAGVDLMELEDRFNKSTRKRHGMHLEHIYAYNEPNMAEFKDSNGIFDEHTCKTERNRLGMVLLLKDSQNISSSNEVYIDKIDTYTKSNFIWNEVLTGHLHSVDKNELPNELQTDIILPNDKGAFPRDRVESRQQLIFNAIKSIWCTNY